MAQRLGALRVLACDSRMRILHLLQERDASVPVEEIAKAVGLHVNTTREHLDRLTSAGFVLREVEHRARRGRPRMLYRPADQAAVATVDARARDRFVRVLVDGYGRALAAAGSSPEAAGEEWADELQRAEAPQPVPDAVRAGHEQLAALERHFEDLGFEPEADAVGLELHLYHCPFDDLVHDRADVVCGVHLGLARGVLARSGGPLVATSLEVHVGPSHCVLHLEHRAAVALG